MEGTGYLTLRLFLSHIVSTFFSVRMFLRAIALGTSVLGSCVNTSPQPSGSVLIKGSETMQPLVALCAEDFMSKHPHVDVVVQGGGSGTGIAAVLHGTVDIGMASRDLSAKEREFAASKGFQLREYTVALDGIAIVVHPDNPITQLNLDQLRQIFTGRVRNWREIGGMPHDMVALGRMASSGTSALFLQRVLAGETYAESVHQMPTNTAIIAEVMNQLTAIGYSGLEAVQAARGQVKVVALQATSQSSPVLPIGETISSGSYPLARALHFYTAGEPSGAIQDFIEFCRSSQGQQLVRKAGFIAIKQ